jgi:putative acetyltransferase
MTIRPYRPEDRAAARLVYFRAIREGTPGLYDDAQREAWADSPVPDLTMPDKLLDQWCWVAEEDGRMTGFMSLCRDGLLDMAFVIPEVMGNGTAAALYDTLLAKAKAEHLARLTVVASAQSRAFLTRRGWRLDHEGPEVHDGQTYHLSHLSLQLIPG